MRKRLAWMPLVAALGVVTLAAGCFPPVDEDAVVTIEGTVLDVDGTPLEGQTIELYKSTVPFWLYGGDWLEYLMELQGNTFRTAITDANGDFAIEMTGKDANNPGGNTAAYFAITLFYDQTREMGIMTEDHVFSNADLNWKVPQMQFWDVEAVDIDPQTLYMDFSWYDLPKNPNHDYLFIVNDGDWAEWVDSEAGGLTDLPVEVLNPETDQCSWQMYAWSTGLLYRSDRHTFTNENTFDPIAADLATDGDGNELPGITDGEYTDAQHFTGATDPTRVILDLGGDYEVTAFVVHHAWIFNWWNGSAVISTSLDGINYDPWDVAVQGDQDQWGLFYHYIIDMPGVACRYIMIELTGSGVEFDYIGELAAFGTPL